MTTRGDTWGAIRGFIDSENVRPLRSDSSTWALETIDYEHHEIHAGSHFEYSGYQSIATDGYLDFCVRTEDSTKESHIVWDVRSNGGLTIECYENPVCTFTTGTMLTAINNNRNSTTVSGWQNFATSAAVSAVIATGTKIYSESSGAGGNTNQSLPGLASRNSEFVLKTNSDYVWRITSLTTATVGYLANWYEHTPKGSNSET